MCSAAHGGFFKAPHVRRGGAIIVKQTAKQIRQRAGLALIRVAAEAKVSETTARVFEIDPQAVRDERKRAALAAVYERLDRELPRAS